MGGTGSGRTGWENERHCATGLLCVPDAEGRRRIYDPLAGELARQQAVLAGTLGTRDGTAP